MKWLTGLMVLLGIASVLQPAVAAPSARYTLDWALEEASGKADELTIAQLEYEAGIQEANAVRSAALPMVNFSTGGSYMNQSIEGQGIATGGTPPGIDRVDGGAFNWSLNLSQPLITFGRVGSAVKIARLRRKMLGENRQLAEDLFYLTVTQAFTQAYLAQEQLRVAEKSAESAVRLLSRVKMDMEAGAVSRRDLLRVQAQKEGAEAQLLTAQNSLETAIIRLEDLIEAEVDRSAGFDLQSASFVAPPAQGGRHTTSLHYRLQDYGLRMTRLQAKTERALLFPQISLVAGINNQFMVYDSAGLTEDIMAAMGPTGEESRNADNTSIAGTETSADNSTAAEQLAELQEMLNNLPKVTDYYNPDFFNYSVGLQLTWTLFDGLRTRSSYRQIRANAEKARLQLKKLEEEDAAAVTEARNTLASLERSMAAAQLALEAAEKAYSQTDEDFTAGFADITTLLDTERQYREAEQAVSGLRVRKLLTVAQLKLALGLPVYKEAQ
jgi:outer membrane protein TolC